MFRIVTLAKMFPNAKIPSTSDRLYVRISIFCIQKTRFIRLEILAMKQLTIIGHTPSKNTQNLRAAVLEGAESSEVEGISVNAITPFEANINDILEADALILGTTENLGYMSGALKDFFDRTYNAALEKTQGLPYALYIRAGMDGTGTKRSVESVTTGLRWRRVQPPLLLRGAWKKEFLIQSRELGLAMAVGLEAGIF